MMLNVLRGKAVNALVCIYKLSPPPKEFIPKHHVYSLVD